MKRPNAGVPGSPGEAVYLEDIDVGPENLVARSVTFGAEGEGHDIAPGPGVSVLEDIVGIHLVAEEPLLLVVLA